MSENQSVNEEGKEKQGFFARLFGGIRMTWVKVVIFAVLAGVYTAAMAIWVPDGNSFRNIAVYPEAWVLFAILILINCEKPLEAAAKTFVFFLISQPLVYLLQVPFSDMGWRIFQYYKYWFIVTLLTFPGAFVGWFIRRKDVIAALILSVMLVLLVLLGGGFFKTMLKSFPNQLLAVIFCYGSVILYILVILRGKWPRLIATGIALAALGFVLIRSAASGPDQMFTEPAQLDSSVYPVDDSWSVGWEDPDFGEARIIDVGTDRYVSVTYYEEGTGMLLLTDPEGKVHHVKVTVGEGDQTEYTPVD